MNVKTAGDDHLTALSHLVDSVGLVTCGHLMCHDILLIVSRESPSPSEYECDYTFIHLCTCINSYAFIQYAVCCTLYAPCSML